MTRSSTAVASGLVGAGVLTAVHELGRRTLPDAPRMDVVGMRGLARLLRSANTEPPERDRLHQLTLVGDLVSNGLYYSAVAAPTPKGTWVRGALLGLAAGIGAVVLPEKLGLGTPPHSHTVRNQVMTVAWYVIGGLAAAAAANAMQRNGGDDGGVMWTPEGSGVPEVPGLAGLSF